MFQNMERVHKVKHNNNVNGRLISPFVVHNVIVMEARHVIHKTNRLK